MMQIGVTQDNRKENRENSVEQYWRLTQRWEATKETEKEKSELSEDQEYVSKLKVTI